MRSSLSASMTSNMRWKYESGRGVKWSRVAVSRYAVWKAGRSLAWPRVTTTPCFADFLMLRRHSWFIPASTSSSVRPASGSWNTYSGWPAAKPSSEARWSKPSRSSRARTRIPASSVTSGVTSRSEPTASSAMAALTVSACQRRTGTAGPIRRAKAPWALTWSRRVRSTSSASGASQSVTGPSGR